MEKQTATEWLFERIWVTPKDRLDWNALLKQAIEMEKKQKYTEEDMLHCWNTLMVAMTNHNPIFFKDYINSLNKQD
jgi:hypothetical protein